MEYRCLGRTGIVVSEIGFGAWGIGGRTVGFTSYGDTDDTCSLAALERAVECGITFFDTSSAYGNGHSEELIGLALGKSRDRVVVATKAGYDSWDQPPDFSAAAVIASAERSLARLRAGYIDLFQLHNAPLEALQTDALQNALSRLIAAGKIRSWGVSAKSPAEAVDALRLCDAPVVQANFNMMDIRAFTSGLFEEVVERRAGFIARTPLCFGFLSGRIGHDTKFLPGDHRLGWPRAQLENWIDGAAEILTAVSATPGRLAVHSALRFCLSFPAVSSVIPGILSVEEVEENAMASALGPLPGPAIEAVLAINRSREFYVAPPRTA
jgi:aryl-alcohol dehydrogenase-like predicted oxidoreductase